MNTEAVMHIQHLHAHTYAYCRGWKWIIYPTQLKSSLTGAQGLTLNVQEYSN